MTRYLTAALIVFCHSQAANAGIIQYFKEDDGSTNWQYVANFSSSLLILLLSIALIKLFFTHRQVRRSNRALKAIRNDLEIRVKERTATLNESNQLLKETNQLLETEVKEHRETANRLRASEAYVGNILASMPLMLVGLKADGEITHWNKRAEEIAAVPASRAIGGNLWEIYPAITVSPDQITKALSDNQPITIKHSQRGRYHFDIIIYPLAEQMEPGVVILIDDVTQRVLTENMLIQRDKMSSLGELASTMAHDINAPLEGLLADVRRARALVNGNSEPSAADQNTVAHLNQVLGDAAEKGQQASAVIANLLTFAGAGGDEKHPEDVAQIMEHSLTLAADVISAPGKLHFRDIAIERDIEPGLPAIPCYRSELQQVFLSLLRHACHALGDVDRPAHTPTIRVEIKERYDALWIKISHNGQGLTYDEQKYIFEPFFNSPTDHHYDASKRLSFSYFIITEHHKGQMAVTSDVNVGTTFHMQIQLS